VEYEDIWSIFENVFNMDYKQIVNLLEKYFIKNYNSYNYDYYWLNSSMNPKWDEIGQRNHIKESLLDKIEGPNKEEVWKSFGYDNVFHTFQDFLDYIFSDLVTFNRDEAPSSKFFMKNDKILFEVNFVNKIIFVEYFDVWLILEKIFLLSEGDTKYVIKKMFEKKFNIIDYRVYHYSNLINSRWWFNEKNHRDYIKESLLDKICWPCFKEY
jgi:hypothetical protein